MNGFADDYDEHPEPPLLTVEVTEPNVLGQLFDTNGKPLFTLLDREVIPFGFQP